MQPGFNKRGGRISNAGDRDASDVRASDKALKPLDARLASDAGDIATWLRSSALVGAPLTTRSMAMLRLRGRVSRDELAACREALCL